MRKYNLALNLLADRTCENCCYKSFTNNICSKRSVSVKIQYNLNELSASEQLSYLYENNLPIEKTCREWRSKDNPKPILSQKEIDELLKACLGDNYDENS